MFKKILYIFITIVMIFSFTSCSKNDGSGYLFKYNLSADPKNLDPQLATDTASLVVIQNMFEGLLKLDIDGKLIEGVAKSYTVSDDGLKYTFTLRENCYWSGVDDYTELVTANDFVFAFKRLFNKETKSPYAEKFFCIKNSQQVYNSTMSSENLGVYANNNYELVFELAYPNANFLNLLATSPAMPCNEEFFYDTRGKYGLESSASIANGPFFLKTWVYDPYGKNNYLILRKNKSYYEVEKVYPSSLNFFIDKDIESHESEFFDGTVDVYISDGTNKKIFGSNYTATEYESNTIGLIFNLKSEDFSNKNIREALNLSINREQYKDSLPKNLTPAYAIVPSAVTMLNKSYRELVSQYDIFTYSSSLAEEKYTKGLAEINKSALNPTKILVPKSLVDENSLSHITQQWQKKLNFYCGFEVVSESEYKSRIESGEYDIAVTNLSCSYNSPEAILNNFRSNSSTNLINYKNEKVDELLSKSATSQNLSDCVDIFRETEEIIAKDFVFIPLFYKTEYLIHKKDVADIIYNPFTKQIDFRYAKNFD